MEHKLPYYMAYPQPLQLDDEKVERRDFEYLKSMYPDMAKKLLPYVEDECDKMEYEGSMIYDEYPDQLQVRLLCRRISGRVMQQETDMYEMDEGQLGAQNVRYRHKRNNWVEDMIQLMVFQELFKRRNDRRRYRRRYY